MVSSFTPNLSLEKPANGDYVDTWSTPVNADWDILDTAFGGVTSINVTGASGTVVLTAAQYRPRIFKFSGTLTANVTYQIPSGVGGIWFMVNGTSGAFSVTISSGGAGTTLALPQGYTTPVISDGTNIRIGYSTSASVAAAGSDTQIQFNQSGALSASGNLTFNYGTNTLTTNTVVATNFTGTLTGPVIGSCTGSSGSCTGNAASATNVANTGTVATNATFYPTFLGANSSSNQGLNTTAAFNFNPATGALSATSFSGAGTGLTGTAGSLSIGGTAATANSLSGSATMPESVGVTAGGTITPSTVGFRGVPASSQGQGSTITLALTDASRRVANTAGGWTIPANATLAIPVDTVIQLHNNSGVTQTVTIGGTDTLTWAGTTSTGTRTVLANGLASVQKVGPTSWLISGNIS